MRYKVSDLCTINKENLSKKDKFEFINYLDTSNITKGSIEEIKMLYVENAKIPSRAKRKVKKNDIIISTVRPNQEHYGFIEEPVDNMIVSTGFAVLTPTEKVDPYYMYLFLTLPNITEILQSIAETSTTTYPSIKPSVIGELEINIPEVEQQKAISNIIKTLDSKIELNNQMNKTLEEAAQALFKRWFVDFEFPNENGEPYKSSGGEMVESEMGMIPKGWDIKSLSSFGKIITGKTPSTKQKENYGDKFNFITPVDMDNNSYIINTNRKLSDQGYEIVKKLLINEDSIGVTCIGSNLGEVYINAKDSFTNQQINSLIPSERFYYPYIYIYLKGMKSDFLNMAGGSAVPIINKTMFSDIKLITPNNQLLECYFNTTKNLFDNIKNNLIESSKLVEVRDTLLPKLMSGGIRVTDIDEANL